jgi:hypothetical protein
MKDVNVQLTRGIDDGGFHFALKANADGHYWNNGMSVNNGLSSWLSVGDNGGQVRDFASQLIKYSYELDLLIEEANRGKSATPKHNEQGGGCD